MCVCELKDGARERWKIHSEVMSVKDSINLSEVLIVTHIPVHTQTGTHTHTKTTNNCRHELFLQNVCKGRSKMVSLCTAVPGL